MKDQAGFVGSLSNYIIRPVKINQHSFRYLNSDIIFFLSQLFNNSRIILKNNNSYQLITCSFLDTVYYLLILSLKNCLILATVIASSLEELHSSCIPAGIFCKVVMFFVSLLSSKLTHFVIDVWVLLVLKQSRVLRVPLVIPGLWDTFCLFV